MPEKKSAWKTGTPPKDRQFIGRYLRGEDEPRHVILRWRAMGGWRTSDNGESYFQPDQWADIPK